MANQQRGPIAQQLQKIQANGQQNTQPNGHQKPVPQKKGWVGVVIRWVFFVVCAVVAIWLLIRVDRWGLGWRWYIPYWLIVYSGSLMPPSSLLVLGLLVVNKPRKRIITGLILILTASVLLLSVLNIWYQLTDYYQTHNWFDYISPLLPPLLLVSLLLITYKPKWPEWTGFGEYISPSPFKEGYQRGKTLWDWLNLLGVFLVPVVIAAGSVWFSIQINETNIQIAQDQRRAEILTTYMDDITDLFLHEGLASSKKGDKVREIATTKTLLILEQLKERRGNEIVWDGTRKGELALFIYKLGLIDAKDTIIVLNGADMRGAYLGYIDLSGADLRGASLSRAYLGGAYLRGAKLTNEQLSRVSSLLYAILPDGTQCLSEIVSECIK